MGQSVLKIIVIVLVVCGLSTGRILSDGAVDNAEVPLQQERAIANPIDDTMKSRSSCTPVGRDCSDIWAKGLTTSGTYAIQPLDDGPPVDVYCDGGWTVFQRRQDGSVDFYRDWESYRQGFGDLDGEFWLGNDNLHRLTAQGDYQLRVDLEGFEGDTAYAVYDTFRVAGGSDKYRLTVGGYSGTAGDSLVYHNQKQFSTKDRGNGLSSPNCALRFRGAWWYVSCATSSLNSKYVGKPVVIVDGIRWIDWKFETLKGSTMKIKMK